MRFNKEEEFMATKSFDARVEKEEDIVFLSLTTENGTHRINLVTDDVSSVNDVFAKLLEQLRYGLFQFELKGEGANLFIDVARAYLSSLNDELKKVYEELGQANLLIASEEE